MLAFLAGAFLIFVAASIVLGVAQEDGRAALFIAAIFIAIAILI